MCWHLAISMWSRERETACYHNVTAVEYYSSHLARETCIRPCEPAKEKKKKQRQIKNIVPWNITLHRYHNSWKPQKATKMKEKKKRNENTREKKKKENSRYSTKKYCDLLTHVGICRKNNTVWKCQHETRNNQNIRQLLHRELIFPYTGFQKKK